MFIPNQKFKVGDLVESTREFQNCAGRFTAGHLFKVIGYGARGYDLEDNDGNKALETGHDGIKVYDRWGR